MELIKKIHEKSIETRERIDSIIIQTPLIPYMNMNQGAHKVFLKLENLQRTGSFKLRGAAGKITGLDGIVASRGIITASAGNHAQGVALSGAARGISTKVYMPVGTPAIKVNGTMKHGAEVILYGDCYDEACRAALDEAERTGAHFVHPFDDVDVIAGQGTIAFELMEALDQIDNVIVPVGGGGLITGMAAVLKQCRPGIRIIGVESKGAMAMTKSLNQHQRVKLDHVQTLAEGTAVKEVGELTFGLSQLLVDEMVTVTEDQLKRTWHHLMKDHKLLTEGAGALSVAALLEMSHLKGNTVCMISGGNMDLTRVMMLLKSYESCDGELTTYNQSAILSTYPAGVS